MVDISKICILVPLYKLSLEEYEYASIKQLFNILGDKYDIRILCSNYVHESINIYKNLFPFNNRHYRFDNSYFVNTGTYSKLLLTLDFYKMLKNDGYDWILIYQSDCWVFKDELEYWVEKGYDYIGAPQYIRAFCKEYDDLHNTYGYNGNGGFSLRNVDSFIRNINDFKYSPLFNDFVDNGNIAEDYIIGTYFKFDKNPSFIECSKFSWEGAPDLLYVINDFQLPFGCHGYHRCYDIFYKKYNLINFNA